MSTTGNSASRLGARTVRYRGGFLGSREFARIQRIVNHRQELTREEIAKEVCRRFGWRAPDGRLAVNSCRLLLLRLHNRGFIRLPASRRQNKAPRKSKAPPSRPAAPSPPNWAADDSRELEGPLCVRPIVPEEQATWRSCIERYHYLGWAHPVGESLRYVALMGDELVALLGWAAAALHNGPRDRYLGWDADTKARRLCLVANNVRFLILPRGRRNLASQILAANLRRLNRDWQAVYGHSVYMAETFVDVARFKGTCYRASNWIYLGQTRGFSRRGASYQPNARPKAVFVYPLHRRAVEFLNDKTHGAETKTEVKGMVKLDFQRLPLDGRGGLLEVLREIPDPRKRRGIRHPMVSVMAVSVCAVLAGAQSLAAIAHWAKDQSTRTLRRLGCRKGRPPSEPTVRRVLGKVDVALMDQLAGEWMTRQTSFAGEGIAIDGKTLRGSKDGDSKAVHLVGAVLHREGVVVAQHRVPDKTNEIKSVEPLFDGMDIEGAVVTGDAMFCQTAIATHLVEDKRADYLIEVKDNQPTLRQDIEDLHLETFPPSARHRG